MVAALQLHQIRVAPTLHDLSVLDHEDQVRALNRREAVGDDQGGPPREELAEGLLDERLALRVQAAGGLVEQKRESNAR